MTVKEFLEKNPEAVQKAANCNSVDEFKKLADEVGIVFSNQDEAKEAFNLIKSQNNNGELDDDALDAVSGGTVRIFDKENTFLNKDGSVMVTGNGRKA